MDDVPELLVEGLAEGLTLRTAEREPADPNGILDRFEDLLGARPSDEAVLPVVNRLADEGLIQAPESVPANGYRLTQDGARRLEAYRRLPDPFKKALVEVFRIDPTSLVDRAPPTDGSSRPRPARGNGDRATDRGGWIEDALAVIPDDVEVRARYARVSFDRDPAAHTWTLRVERHEPGRYEGAGACPLTFLFRAATRLLTDARAPSQIQAPEDPRPPARR